MRERAVVTGEKTGGRLADVRDAERVDNAVERYAAALVDRGDHLGGADFAPAFALGDVVEPGFEPEDVAGLADQPVLPEGADVLLAETLDVEIVARHEVLQALDRLCRADQAAGAAPRRHAGLTHREAVADGTMIRELVRLGIFRAAFEDDADDLRDDIAGPLHDDRVALPRILALDLVLVVQGGALHDDAANRDRLQDRGRGQGPLPPDCDHDVAHDCLRLLGGEFMRQGPARRAAAHAEPVLQVEIVDLVDDPVDVVGQLAAARFEIVVIGDELGDAAAQL